MSVLVDTNVLLRGIQVEHPSHQAARVSLAGILRSGEPVCFTPQNIAEFWNVATRPAANNGLGFSLLRVEREVDEIERALTLLPDLPVIYAEWRRLVVEHGVRGAKVHDVRLVAAMNVYAVRKILTLNTDDFKRFGVQTLHPAEPPATS